MEVLDRIKRRFDGGDGDDVAKQNNQQNNQQRRESEWVRGVSVSVSEAGRMYKNDTHLRYPSRPLAGQAEKTRNPHATRSSNLMEVEIERKEK